MSNNSNTQWIHGQLSKVLGFEVPQEMIGYIVSMETAQDLEDYCRSLLNFENAEHKQFYDDLLRRLNGNLSKSVSDQPLGYKKPLTEEIYFVGNTEKKSSKNKKSGNQSAQISSKDETFTSVKEDTEQLPDSGHGATKKRPKFVNLYSQEGQSKDTVLLKGRHVCQCQAGKHKLVNNCVKCGRIVCEQEGQGPCFFCGSLVCSPESMKVLQRNSRQSESLLKKLLSQGKPSDFDAAMAQRNRLLEYDRTSERRTKVIDDESDYYSSNSVWLSESERSKLRSQEEAERARKHASRREARFTLDFAGRQVMEEKAHLEMINDEEDRRALKELQGSGCHANLNLDPGIDFPELTFQRSVISELPWRKSPTPEGDMSFPQPSRVQDKEFLEMTDSGRCLSMHQPWASLLISGIKLHEGRNWYTSHRGRLWIAAAAKEPDLQEIRTCENVIRTLKRDENIRFPEHYPTGCLLGCVTVTECLAQEEYRQKYPDGESDSPFVFICEDPLALPVRFPMQGQHKIYSLDSKIHNAAQKSIQRMAKICAERNSEK
ncbi:Activating signal cointegrator 1 [Frankliniella fusca]|uniref:Activating signal cointegrator 1 n=1 Tax=Frankliniella fusca TaxID=407009 RepID=A0AAE1HP57_9NEOP|nr:Activating signal cointegrator 1 [Frankliniella fusca]